MIEWNTVKNLLSEKITASAHRLWIEPLHCLEANQDGITLAAPDRFFCSWVMENYQPAIKQCLTQLGFESIKIDITVSEPACREERKLLASEKHEQLRLPSIPYGRSQVRALHPRYTFNEFMIGESNALACSACESIAKNDTSLGNCIYIDSGTGLGKSHLTHAVAHHILENSPMTRLHYLSAQQLTAEMVKSIKENSMDKFKEKFHQQCDVLLMEDIHTIAGRTKTQEELAAALDILMEQDKRIIFTGSVPPRDIPNIDPGFRSRLSSGLVTTINPPDHNTRVHIVRRKAANSSLKLSETLVVYLAENIRGDIRQIESAIVGLKAKSSILKTDPDLDMVKEVIASIVGNLQTAITTETIRDFIAKQYKVTAGDLKSKSRKKDITFPRQIGMYLSRKLTDQALCDIGRVYNRDHSTVVHSIRVITDSIAADNSVRGQIELLADRIQKKFA